MDEKSADDKQDEASNSQDKVKRFKTNDAERGLPEQRLSDSTCHATGSSASTSASDAPSPVRFLPSPNIRTRNYRRSRGTEEQSDELMEEAPPVEVEASAAEEEMDQDWETYDDAPDDENEDVGDASDDDSHLFSPSSSSDDSTVILDTDNETDIEEHPVFKKQQPKHSWFLINEVNKRQLGYSSKLQSHDLFQRRCYGSLSIVKRLELMGKLEVHEGCVNSLNFHPNGTLLASGADDLKIVIWDWSKGKVLLKYKTKHRGNVFQSKFLHLSGDLHVASCARDGQVRLAHLASDEGVRNARLLGAHRGPCHKLIVLPEQPHIILSAGEDGAVFNHDVRGPKSNRILTVKDDAKTIALYSIHGHPLKTNEFCVSGRDSFVRVYDQRKTGKPLALYTPFVKSKGKNRNHHVTCAVYNHNGTEILASYSDADLYLFDVNDTKAGKFVHQYQGHRNGATIKGVNFFGPKSEFVVSGSDCGYIYMWERNTEALVQWLLGDYSGVVNCLEPHPQVPFMATSGLDWDVKIWAPLNVEGPRLEGLNGTLKHNLKPKIGFPDMSENNERHMFTVLLRLLRRGRRMRPSNTINLREFLQSNTDSNSSPSESSSHSGGSNDEDDEDDFDLPPNCYTS